MALYASGQRILLPVNPWFIAFTMAVAFLFNLLPWRDVRGVPDLLALVIVFWAIREPRKIGIGTPFALGVLMDAANGVLLGQHALAYSVMAFMAITLSRRILWFGPVAQAAHVLGILFVGQLLMFAVRAVAGASSPGWLYFLGPLIAAALWPLASFLMLAPQRRPESVDETRPI